MSHLFSHVLHATPSTFGTAEFTLMARRIADTWGARRRRTAQRRDLQSLDEHALRDIGLSHRAAAESPQEPRGRS